jgi:hypothetical protein
MKKEAKVDLKKREAKVAKSYFCIAVEFPFMPHLQSAPH